MSLAGMDSSENVAELAHLPAQLDFEGHAVTGVSEKLKAPKANKNAPVRVQFTPVKGWFEGWVQEVNFDGAGDGATGREQVIVVSEWGVE